MISYGGVTLGHTSPELVAWVKGNIDPNETWETSTRFWPGKNLVGLPFRAPPPPDPNRIGVLRWPTTASRFACAHYLATQDDLDAIRSVIYQGSTYLPATLTLDAADGSSVSPSMYLLPARPLQQIGGEGFYLLTLVDERFFWWSRAANISVVGGTTTWAQLYASIATGLGITLTVDAIPAAYLKPPAALGTAYEALPLLLDAVAACVGQRVVRQLDGSVRAWSVTASRDSVLAQLAAVPASAAFAGGVFALGA